MSAPLTTKQRLIRLLATVAGVGVVFAVFWYGIYPHFRAPDASLNPDPNHTHADFALWVRGEQLDFSGDSYQSGVPQDSDTEATANDYLHPYLHLHDNIGHVAHKHKPELFFREFLESLGMEVSSNCITLDNGAPYCNGSEEWRFFVNGEERQFSTIMSYEFSDLDTVLLTYAASEDDVAEQLKKMTDDACLYSKACPWRGDPPAENCIADPSIPCTAPLVEDDFS